jgi:hypothetical protein
MMTDDDDPTRMRNQPALTTSHGLEWLVIGAITAVICIVVLLFQLPSGVALAGAVTVFVSYMAMLVVRFSVARLKLRLRLLAALLGLMLLVTLVDLIAVIYGA